MASFDHLQLANDKKALKALTANSAGNDKVLFSLKLVKINRKGKGQNRVLLITSRHILNLMPDNYSKCNRCVRIDQLHHVTKSDKSQEFVMHLTDDYDYRFKTPLYAQAVEVLAMAFSKVTGAELNVDDKSSKDSLAQEVMTKTALKKMGNSWGPVPASYKLASSSKGDDDDGEDSENEGEDGVSELVGSLRVGEPGAAGSSHTAGGAFGRKGRYAIDDFVIMKVLGKGAFGKVMLVRAKDTGVIYAMKSLSKQQLLEKNEVVHTKTERKALEDTHHPFLVHLRFAFQSPSKLYLVMDYCNGGELFFHLKETGRFPEPRARLYAAEICSAIHHLHDHKIIYRDLKPENVLLDCEGHVRITDFGLAKDSMDLSDRTHTFCGTPDYLAPEVIREAGHGRGVDWWSLGTMIYEMLGGLPPYYSENVNIMYERILNDPLEFKPPELFSSQARDLVKGLLQKDPVVRLGSSERDGHDLREHPWFAPIDWVALEKREIEPPFKPSVSGETDVSNFDDEFTSQAVESVVPASMLANPRTANFDGFTYVDQNHLG